GYAGSQSGSGANVGALHVLGNNTAWGDGETTLTLNANSTIGVDSGTIVFNGLVTNTTSTLNKVGPGTFEMRGDLPNANTGTTIINDGTLRLNKRPGAGQTGGSFIVGDNTGPSEALEVASAEQITDNQSVTVNAGANFRTVPFDVPSKRNEVQRLQVSGGSFQLTFNGGSTAILPFNIPASGRFFSALNEVQQITNTNGVQNGGFT